MEKLQSFEDFQEILRRDTPDKTNIERLNHEIKQACAQYLHTHLRKRRYKTVILLSMLLVVVFSSLAFAGSMGYKLFGDDGKVLYEMTQMKEEDIRESNEYIETDELTKMKESLKSELKPGESMVLIDVDRYEATKRFYHLEQPIVINEFGSCLYHVPENFKMPSFMPSGYEFEEGIIHYANESIPDELPDKLYEKAKRNGLKYAYEKLEQAERVGSIDLLYAGSDGNNLQIRVSAAKNFGFDEYSEAEKSNIQKLKVNGHEVLYSENTGFAIWVESEPSEKIKYEIWQYGIRSGMDKEEIIKIVKGFK